MEAAIEKLLLIDGRVANYRHATGEPVLAEFLKALYDLVTAGLAHRKVDYCAIDGDREACACTAFPCEDSTRSIGRRELRLRAGHARRISTYSLCSTRRRTVSLVL